MNAAVVYSRDKLYPLAAPAAAAAAAILRTPCEPMSNNIDVAQRLGVGEDSDDTGSNDDAQPMLPAWLSVLRPLMPKVRLAARHSQHGVLLCTD